MIDHRLGLEEIDGSGATAGQVPVWNPDYGGVWQPGTVGGSSTPAREFPVSAHGAVGDGTTDDTAAIQATIDACATAGGGIVTFDAKTYLCNGALSTARNGNAVLTLPTGRAPIHLRGVSPANNCDPTQDTGRYTIIKTTKTGLAYSGTNGVPSLLGGPTATVWAETTVKLENICFHLPHNPTLAGVDLRYVRRIMWDGCTVVALNAGDADFVQPTSVYAFGLRTPENQNYNAVLVRNGGASGVYVGIVGSVESVTMTYWSSKWCVIGWAPMTGGHGGQVAKLSTEWCNYHLSGWSETAGATSLVNSPTGETKALLTIHEWAIEDAAAGAGWYTTTAHVNDSTNRLYGVVQYDRYANGTGVTSGLTVTGGSNLTRIALLAPSFGSSSSLTVQDENANVATGVTQIDFQGAGVTAAAGTGEVVVTIPGSSSSSGELLMQDGVTGPPVPIETEARDDWLYQG